MILLVGGSHVVFDQNGNFCGVHHFVKYVHGLADIFGHVSIVTELVFADCGENYFPFDRNKVEIIPCNSRDYKGGKALQLMRCWQRIFNLSKQADAVLESFPAARGLIASIGIRYISRCYVVYFKNDPLAYWRPTTHDSLTSFLKKIYIWISALLIERIAHAILVRDKAQFDKLQSMRPDQVFLSAPKSNFWYIPHITTRQDILEEVNLLFVGKLMQSKGINELLDMMMLLKKDDDLSNFNIRLTIVGGEVIHQQKGYFTDRYFTLSDLQEILHLSHLEDDIVLTGFVGDVNRLATYYKNAHIFVFPSHFEGFPRVLDEATIWGLPIVCTDLPGIKSIYRDGYHALMVPVGDVEALANAVKQLILDSALRRSLIEHAREIAKERHKITSAEQHARILQNCKSNLTL